MKRYLLFCAGGGLFHTSYKNIDLTDFQRRWDGVFWDSPREAYRRIRAWRAQTLSGKFYVKLSKPHHFRFLEACKPPSKVSELPFYAARLAHTFGHRFRLEQLNVSGPSVKRLRHPAIPPPEEGERGQLLMVGSHGRRLGGMGIDQYLLAFMTFPGAITIWQLNSN